MCWILLAIIAFVVYNFWNSGYMEQYIDGEFDEEYRDDY